MAAYTECHFKDSYLKIFKFLLAAYLMLELTMAGFMYCFLSILSTYKPEYAG
jgi:hypothetical protein